MVGFLDDYDVLKGFAFPHAHAVVIDPEEQTSDDEGFVGIGEAVQFQDDVSFEKLFYWDAFFGVYDFVQAGKADGVEGSFTAHVPEHFPSASSLLVYGGFHLLKCGIVHDVHQNVACAGSEKVCFFHDFDELFLPYFFIGIGWRDLGVEGEGAFVSSDRVNKDFFILEIRVI